MKKATLVYLFGLALFLVGCTQQTPTANQDINQPIININQDQNTASVSGSQPLITLLSPNDGEVWKIGSTQTITWKSVDLPSNDQILISLVQPNGGACILARTTTNQNKLTLVIPSICPGRDAFRNIVPGQYKIELEVPLISIPENPKSYRDFSDDYFTITTSTDPIKTVTISMWPDVNSFDLREGVNIFEATNLTSKEKIIVKTTNATKFYKIVSPKPNEYFDIRELYSIIKNWEGPTYHFTLTGTVQGDGPIIAKEIYYTIQ